MRLFTAIEIEGTPAENIKGFLAVAQGFDLPVKWVDSKKLHLTLVFLGETKPEQMTNLTAALKMGIQGYCSFELEMGGLGAFPNMKKPNALFMNVLQGRDEVVDLFEKMAGPLEKAGFPRENRKFSPHVTLGRVREEGADPTGWERVQKAAPASLGSFVVKEIKLIESKLTPRGSIYTNVEVFPLIT